MKVKRIVPLLLATIVLCSCGLVKNAGFNQSLLKDYGISDLPELSNEITYANQEGSRIFASIGNQEYNDYVNSVVNYFLHKDTIHHFGKKEQKGLMAEMLPDYVVIPLEENGKYDSSIVLCYSLTEELSEGDDGTFLLINPLEIDFDRANASTLSVSHNLTIEIRESVSVHIVND